MREHTVSKSEGKGRQVFQPTGNKGRLGTGRIGTRRAGRQKKSCVMQGPIWRRVMPARMTGMSGRYDGMNGCAKGGESRKWQTGSCDTYLNKTSDSGKQLCC